LRIALRGMTRRILLPFILAFALLLTAIFFSRKSYRELVDHNRLMFRTHEVILNFENLAGDLKNVETLAPAYEHTPDKYKELYHPSRDNLLHDVRKVKQLVVIEEQRRRIDSIEQILNRQLDWILKSNINDSILQYPESPNVKDILLMHALLDRGIARAKERLEYRRKVLDKKQSNVNFWIATIIGIALILILMSTIAAYVNLKKRKHAELFLESILNSTRNGIISYAALRNRAKEIVDFRAEFVNEAVEAEANVNPGSIIGKRIREVNPKIVETGFFNKLVSVVNSGKPMSFEYYSEATGNRHWYIVQLAKREDGVTVCFHNISDIKNYEKELESMISQLKQSNHELEQFAYVASHDLQEPLRKIKIFSGLISKDTDTEPAKSYLQRTISAAERMSTLIDDLLDYSRLTRAGQQFELTDLNKIVQNVLNDYELLISQKNARINIMPLPVLEAIPLQMNQLFYNLIGNALKFTKTDTTPQVDIKVRKLTTEEVEPYPLLSPSLTYFEITIKDNGIGFNQEFAEQIFTIFQRLHHNMIYPGSGIGLALCRKIILNHNGEIDAVGKENEGACFKLILPEHHVDYTSTKHKEPISEVR
jgi:signal transduction histidine kinase/CHASE3 domain sensor protein